MSGHDVKRKIKRVGDQWRDKSTAATRFRSAEDSDSSDALGLSEPRPPALPSKLKPMFSPQEARLMGIKAADLAKRAEGQAPLVPGRVHASDETYKLALRMADQQLQYEYLRFADSFSSKRSATQAWLATVVPALQESQVRHLTDKLAVLAKIAKIRIRNVQSFEDMEFMRQLVDGRLGVTEEDLKFLGLEGIPADAFDAKHGVRDGLYGWNQWRLSGSLATRNEPAEGRTHLNVPGLSAGQRTDNNVGRNFMTSEVERAVAAAAAAAQPQAGGN